MTTQLEEQAHKPGSPRDSSDTQSERPAPSAPPRMEVDVAEDGAAICYANFFRVTGTPEELILDLGLNSQPFGATTTIDVKNRLVVNYYTAKRLFQALGMSIQRHETAFGLLETDVQKRITPALRRSAAPG